MRDALYIDKLTYQELGSRSAKVLRDSSLDEKKITKVLSLIGQGKLTYIDASNEEESVSITVHIDGQKFWVGVLDSCDEISYIYDNQTGNENAVAVAGNDYPGWAICTDAGLIKQILEDFFYNGTRLSSVTWREDDI